MKFSDRANIIMERTYARPLEGGGSETWPQVVDRVVKHQRWLWQRAKGDVPLEAYEERELESLRTLMEERKVSVSGRTLWLGGTDVAKRREASQFNCAFTKIETVHDVVDAFWLLLQGCGVGFEPVDGTLNGFQRPHEIRIIRSQRHLLEQTKGIEYNREFVQSGEWHIQIGDSAEAWAKAVGKVLAGKHNAETLVLDFRQIRPAGQRLKGYGWISSGDATFATALEKICQIMNDRDGQLLTKMNILDIMNLLGTTLSSRRSAEIALMNADDPDWRDFALAKKDFWLYGREHRQQSNNSLVFHSKPSVERLTEIFELMAEAGGSEPGFINGVAAKKRAPWFKGFNPCAEIILPNKGFCNLVEINLAAFEDLATLKKAIRVIARANYRQTCVNLDDGILQRAWHENNEFLRLCGVGLTGIVNAPLMNRPGFLREIREYAQIAVQTMADELGMPRSKAVTTVKPSGTLSKIMDTTEGAHRPLGKYIFNNVRFGRHDPLIEKLRAANYRVFDDPSSPDAVLVTFPVAWDNVKFDIKDGVAVNLETAVQQLERYKRLATEYVDHNCSVTISYSPEEVPEIIGWLLDNWDHYVGVSFLYRADPTKTAKDLGYLYLPQEVVTKEVYDAYVKTLRSLEGGGNGQEELLEAADDYVVDAGDECAGGVCPIR